MTLELNETSMPLFVTMPMFSSLNWTAPTDPGSSRCTRASVVSLSYNVTFKFMRFEKKPASKPASNSLDRSGFTFVFPNPPSVTAGTRPSRKSAEFTGVRNVWAASRVGCWPDWP